MPTFAEIKTKVSKKLQDPNNTAVSSADVGDAINDAINYWKYRRFWFNEESTTIVLSSGSTLVPSIPSNFLYEFSDGGLVIIDSIQSYPLTKVSPRDFDALNTQAVGRPQYYTFRDGSYHVYPYPDQAYTLNLYYVKEYAVLSGDSDSNDFTDKADQLLTYETLKRLYSEYRQDHDTAAYYEKSAQREFENLLKRTFKQTGRGRLTVETI